MEEVYNGRECPTPNDVNIPCIIITPPSPVMSDSGKSVADCGSNNLARLSEQYPEESVLQNVETQLQVNNCSSNHVSNDDRLIPQTDRSSKAHTEGNFPIPTKPLDKTDNSIPPQDSRLLGVSEDTVINVSRPNNATSDVTSQIENDTTTLCHYASTPKNKGDRCFNDSLSSIETPSPISHIESAEASPQCTQHNENATHKDYLNQSYNRSVPLPRDNDLRSPVGKLNFNFERPDRMPSSDTYFQQNYFSPNGCYYPKNDSSWLDLTYNEISPAPQMSFSGSSDYLSGPSGRPDGGEYFVYPSIYVSSAGLISVLLKNDMSVEMTVDRTIRVVSHNHMMAVATDSRGEAACLYHPSVKVFQIGNTTDIATDSFRARMGAGDNIVFSNGTTFFRLEDWELQPTAPLKFNDILRDQSVNLLFSSEGYGESLVASCMQVAAQAEYSNLPKGGVIVRINGVKVTQTGSGDVTVVTGAKFIRLSPHLGTTRLSNRFVDIEVEKDWSVKLSRGSHSFFHSRKCSMVSNGKMEAGYDDHNGLKVTHLQTRHPLLTDPAQFRRPVKKAPPPRSLLCATYMSRPKPGPGCGRGTGF